MSAQEPVSLPQLPSRSENIDLVRAFYAKKILEESQAKYDGLFIGGPYGLPSAPTLPPDTDVEAISYQEAAPQQPEGFSIGILGAGVAGLYTALMIDSLGPDSGITYQILEADQRIGGRLFTYKFEGHAEDDYYVGPPP